MGGTASHGRNRARNTSGAPASPAPPGFRLNSHVPADSTGCTHPCRSGMSSTCPRQRRTPSVLDSDLDVTPERDRCTTDRREGHRGVVTLEQAMNHGPARAHAPRELGLRHLLLLHGPMQFGGELSLDGECRRFLSRSVVLHRFVCVALRATSRLLPSHMYLQPLPRQGAANRSIKGGATLAHRMLQRAFRMIPVPVWTSYI
jgi:hypothetical protein